MSSDGVAGRSSAALITGCTIGMTIGGGPIIFQTFGHFIIPMSRDLGWGRGQLSSLLTCASWAAALAMPLVGRAMDKSDARSIIGWGLFFFGLVNIGLGFVSSERWQLYGAYLLMGFVSAATSVIGYARILSIHFDRRRGLALGFSLGAGSAIGGALIPVIAGLLISAHGWRYARSLLGLIILSCAPVVTLLLRASRTRSNTVAIGSSGGTGLPPREVLSSRNFWLTAIASLLTNTSLAGITAHLVPLLTDSGVGSGYASAAFAVFASTHLVGQMAGGYLLDRYNTPKVAILFFLVALTGLLMIHHLKGPTWTLGGIIAMGAGHGAELGIVAYFFSRFFGVKSFGQAYSGVILVGILGSGLGPLFMGSSFDRNGSYSVALWWFEGAVFISAILIHLLRPYQFSTDSVRTNSLEQPSTGD